MRAKEIDRRRAALGLTKKRLAELAKVDETGLGRALNGDIDPKNSTVEKVLDALVAEERRRLAHLIALHGVPEQPGRRTAA